MTIGGANKRQRLKAPEKQESELLKTVLEKPIELSDDQKRAVLSKARYNRIIAGAGAGKTETLTRKIAFLLLVEKVKPAAIVAFTFTEKAAQSMKSRIYQRVEQIAGPTVAAGLGEMYIGTIHAYAKRILEDYFEFGNYGVLDENQEIAFLMRHGWNLCIDRFGRTYAQTCRDFLRTVNMVWGEMLDEKKLEKKAPEFYNILKRYERLLKKHRQLTFGKMIYLAVLNLRDKPETLSHVQHLIVDEYQDINQAQAELIGFAGKNGSIFVVGDPRQSIYQWRGSDEKFFDVFSKTFSGTDTVTIRENRRSTRKIVRNANKFAESFERAHYEPMDPIRHEHGFIGIASHDTPEDEARWIVDQIEDLVVRKKAIEFSDVGVLTRSVSTSAEPLIHELRRRRIPYIVGGKVGLFRRDEAQALGRIFSWFWEDGFWVEDPWRWSEQVQGDDLLTSALVFWDSVHTHGHPDDAEAKLRKIKENLNSFKSSYSNFTKIYYDVLTALGYERLDYTVAGDAAVMANLGRFNNLLTDYESANRIGGRAPKWARDLKGLCWFMNSYALQAYEEQPSDDVRGVDAVQVMTIHQAKGLEWPIVFLFSAVKRRFPPSRLGRPQNWCGVPRDMFDATRYEGNVEDERRLFYVSITRARDALVVSHFNRITRNVGRCMFIEDMDSTVTTDLRNADDLPDVAIHPSLVSEEIQTFSAGEIITYNVCPHMYLLRDLWGYQPELNPAIGYGNSLHYCLRRAGELVKNEGYSPLSAVVTSVNRDFHMPFVGGVVLDKFRNSARGMLVEFSKRYGDDLERIEEIEYRLEFPVQNATIMGKVDVIMREGGNMEVRDYKTSDEVRTFNEISVQVRLYTVGLRSLGWPVTSGSVAYLETSEVKMVDVAGLSLEEARKLAEKTVENIVRRNFLPNPGENCKRCDQRQICRWRRD
jgi:DNA helicase-2/ATP-dependent DNA helicase PcrA